MFDMCPYCARGCKCGRQAYSEGTCIYCGHGIPHAVENYAEHAARHIRTTGNFDARVVSLVSRSRPRRASVERRKVWDASAILVAIRAWARDTGHAPTATEWRAASATHPCHSTVTRLFGSWADGIVAAGFLRPTRGRRTSSDLGIAA